MKTCMHGLVAVAALSAGLALAPAADAAIMPDDQVVNVELVLLVDTSGSVDAVEYEMQRDGYADAFESEELIKLILNSVNGRIAVCYVEWSSADHQALRVPWVVVDSEASSMAFAQQIRDLTRTHEGSTKIAPAIAYAAAQLETNGYYGLKRVVDVSGDGRCQNYDYYAEHGIGEVVAEEGEPWQTTLPAALNHIDVINAISITSNFEVMDFYDHVLPQGEDAFSMQVDSFDKFGDAILEKLKREVTHPPIMFD